jgi:hypothetical protein
MRWRLRWVEERVIDPDVIHVLQPEVRVLEQVRGLSVDLEGILVEQIEVEAGHVASV